MYLKVQKIVSILISKKTRRIPTLKLKTDLTVKPTFIKYLPGGVEDGTDLMKCRRLPPTARKAVMAGCVCKQGLYGVDAFVSEPGKWSERRGVVVSLRTLPLPWLLACLPLPSSPLLQALRDGVIAFQRQPKSWACTQGAEDSQEVICIDRNNLHPIRWGHGEPFWIYCIQRFSTFKLRLRFLETTG